MTNKYYLAKSDEMDKRKSIAEEFYDAMLDPEEIPYIVTDDACIYDFFAANDQELVEKVKQKYGVTIEDKHFKMPFWQFLDWLEENKTK